MSRDLSGKTYWLVGASEGLGRALAHQLARVGARLILSARNAGRLDDLAAELGGSRVLALDVTDPVSVAQAVAAVGAFDGLIYSVGLYEPMASGDWDPAAAEAMVDANFIGAMRLLGRVVPAMIGRDAGHVVLIGSIAGYRGLPGAIGYGASKAALMHLAENLHADTQGTGVVVQLANPGFIRTRLTDKNDFAMPAIMSAEDAAARVLRLMQSDRFSADFPHPFAWLFSLGRLLPTALFHRLIRS